MGKNPSPIGKGSKVSSKITISGTRIIFPIPVHRGSAVPVPTTPIVSHSGSAVPVLSLLSAILQPKRILELGAGGYSTTLFADKSVFKDMEKVDSFENGPDTYKDGCRGCFGKDDDVYKLHFFPNDQLMSDIIKTKDLTMYDLILVDDSFDARYRSRTIKHVISAQPDHQVVVVHDFEYSLYQRAARGDHYQFIFNGIKPWVAVIWKQIKMPVPLLYAAQKVIKKEITNKDQEMAGFYWYERFEKLMKDEVNG